MAVFFILSSFWNCIWSIWLSTWLFNLRLCCIWLALNCSFWLMSFVRWNLLVFIWSDRNGFILNCFLLFTFGFFFCLCYVRFLFFGFFLSLLFLFRNFLVSVYFENKFCSCQISQNILINIWEFMEAYVVEFRILCFLIDLWSSKRFI